MLATPAVRRDLLAFLPGGSRGVRALRGRKTSWLLTTIFVLVGLFVGNRIGDAIQAVVPAAAKYSAVAIKPRDVQFLDLGVTAGFSFRVNLLGAIGGLAGLFLARRV